MTRNWSMPPSFAIHSPLQSLSIISNSFSLLGRWNSKWAREKHDERLKKYQLLWKLSKLQTLRGLRKLMESKHEMVSLKLQQVDNFGQLSPLTFSQDFFGMNKLQLMVAHWTRHWSQIPVSHLKGSPGCYLETKKWRVAWSGWPRSVRLRCHC
jgi:hypothetical protein